MRAPPFSVSCELLGWTLFLAELARTGEAAEELAALRRQVAERARRRHAGQSLAEYPSAAALRRLFRGAGCDPTRYRPSSEALLRRLLKGGAIPAIDPLVDINNCLSAELVVPCCVMAAGSFRPPLRLRRGLAGEAYDSLRGLFRLHDKPVLVDAAGACDTPITGSQRVKVTAETLEAWLVAYLPAAEVDPVDAEMCLQRLLAVAPVARVLRTASA